MTVRAGTAMQMKLLLDLRLGCETSDWDGEVGGVVGQETGDGSVHGSKTTDDAETASSLCEGGVSSNVCGGKDKEGDGNVNKDKHKSNGRAGKTDGEESGDDAPHDEVETDGLKELVGVLLVRGLYAEPGNLDNSPGHPECTVACEGTGSEGVTACPLHAATDDLAKTTVEESDTDEDVGDLDVTSAKVVHGQQDGGAAESHQSKRGWVGKLPVEDGESWLRVVLGVTTWCDEARDLSTRLVGRSSGCDAVGAVDGVDVLEVLVGSVGHCVGHAEMGRLGLQERALADLLCRKSRLGRTTDGIFETKCGAALGPRRSSHRLNAPNEIIAGFHHGTMCGAPK